MTIPKLTDVSPELHDALVKYDNMTMRSGELRAEQQRLWRLKRSGETSQDKEARIEAIINGEALTSPTNIDSMISEINAQWRALEEAREIHLRRIVDLKRKAGTIICEKLRPEHDEIMKRLSKALLESHAAYVQFESFKRKLVINDCGLFGVCNLEPDFLEDPGDRTSSLAQYFRAAKSAGYIKALPAELR